MILVQSKQYETARLVLKVLDESYADKVLDYHIRNSDFLAQWEPIRGESFYRIDYHRNQLQNDTVSIESGNALRLWVFKKDEPDKIIGVIAFNNIVKGVFLSCHLGYKLDKDELNKGYISEAIKKGIEIIFDQYKLHRIEANIMPRNKASLRVVEKLGFYNEGLAYKYLKIHGKWEDHIHMVLLNDNM
jgi:[ribosomal protein S5]-alanine N-acetyltransferase